MSRPRLSENTKLAILRAYQAGEKLTDIAARFGVEQSYATILAGRRGLPRRQPRKTRAGAP